MFFLDPSYPGRESGSALKHKFFSKLFKPGFKEQSKIFTLLKRLDKQGVA
jgi:hypothetical protein